MRLNFIFLVIFILIEISKYYAETHLGIKSPNSKPFHENNLVALIQNIFLIQAIGPTGNTNSFNIPAWSISVEFYTYFVFALIIYYFEKIKNLVFIFIFLGAIILIITNNTYGFESLLQCYSGFFLGCTVANIKLEINVKLNRYLSLIAFIVVVFFLVFKTDSIYDPYIFLLSAILILTITVNKDGYLNKIMKFRFLSWLGTISFSMYMSHYFIIWIMNQFMRVILKKREIVIHGISIPQLGIIETLISIVLIIAIVLIVSKVVYEYIEKPLRLRSREFVFSKRF